jgi:hypothetical protein
VAQGRVLGDGADIPALYIPHVRLVTWILFLSTVRIDTAELRAKKPRPGAHTRRKPASQPEISIISIVLIIKIN